MKNTRIVEQNDAESRQKGLGNLRASGAADADVQVQAVDGCPVCGVPEPGLTCFVCGHSGPHVEPVPRDRDTVTGKFTKNNLAAETMGAYSLQRAQLRAPLLLTMRADVLRAKGYTEADADPVLISVVDRFNEATLLAESFIAYISEAGGATTSKGNKRRAYDHWSRAAGMVAKFGAMLGLERRQRAIVQSPHDWLQAETATAPATDTSIE